MPVRDPVRATAFYRDVLRLPFLFDAPPLAFFDCASRQRPIELWLAFFADGEGNTLALMSEVPLVEDTA